MPWSLRLSLSLLNKKVYGLADSATRASLHLSTLVYSRADLLLVYHCVLCIGGHLQTSKINVIMMFGGWGWGGWGGGLELGNLVATAAFDAASSHKSIL